MNDHGFWIRSRANDLLWKKRGDEKRHITIEDVAAACKISLSTAGRFLNESSAAVSQSEIIAAVEIAEYFGVSLYGDENSLLVKETGEQPERRKTGVRGRPPKNVKVEVISG